jgi:hypothetical protein
MVPAIRASVLGSQNLKLRGANRAGAGVVVWRYEQAHAHV